MGEDSNHVCLAAEVDLSAVAKQVALPALNDVRAEFGGDGKPHSPATCGNSSGASAQVEMPEMALMHGRIKSNSAGREKTYASKRSQARLQEYIRKRALDRSMTVSTPGTVSRTVAGKQLGIGPKIVSSSQG